MSAESIHFLQLRRRGYHLDGIFQDALDKKVQELGEKISGISKELIAEISEVETGEAAILRDISALDITKKAKAQVEAEKEQIEKLKNAQSRLQDALKTKKEELDQRKGGSAKLNSDLRGLNKNVKDLPSPYESELYNVGGSMVQNIGNR